MGCCCSKNSGSQGTQTWSRPVTPSPKSSYSSASPMSYRMSNLSGLITDQPASTTVPRTDYTCRGALRTSSMNTSSMYSSESLSIPAPVHDRRGGPSKPVTVSRYAILNVDDPVKPT